MAEYIEREAINKISFNDTVLINGKVRTERIVLVRDIEKLPAADVETVRHGRCDVCAGKAIMTQDCYNGYSLEVDAEQQELSIWSGDECLAVFQIDYCPNCGAKMDGGAD